MSLFQTLQADLLSERKKLAKADKRRVACLNFVVAQIKQKLIDQNESRDSAGDDMVIQVLRKQIKQLEGTLEVISSGDDRAEESAAIQQEVTWLAAYLPAAPSEEALTTAIDEILSNIDQPSPKSMGQVIGMLRQKFDASCLDMGKVSQLVKQKLANLGS